MKLYDGLVTCSGCTLPLKMESKPCHLYCCSREDAPSSNELFAHLPSLSHSFTCPRAFCHLAHRPSVLQPSTFPFPSQKVSIRKSPSATCQLHLPQASRLQGRRGSLSRSAFGIQLSDAVALQSLINSYGTLLVFPFPQQMFILHQLDPSTRYAVLRNCEDGQ